MVARAFSRGRRLVLTVAVFGAWLLAGATSSVGANGATPAFVYVSSSSAGVVDGISFGSEDILRYDTVTDTWTMFFDGSDMNLGPSNVDGFSIVDSGPSSTQIVLSLAGPRNLGPGLGVIDDSDALLFTGTSGPATSGTLNLLLDASDVGLTAGGEDIDAIGSDGPDFALSTLGSASTPKTGGGTLAARDEDLISLASTSTGNLTAGTFTLSFDGSDVGLGGEDIDGAWVDPATGVVYFSLTNAYNLSGISGDSGDIVAFTGATGDNTSGTFSLFFDDDAHRFGSENIDGLDIEFQSGAPTGSADLSITKVDTADPVAPGDTVTYTIEVSNAGPDAAANVVVSDVLPAGVTFGSTTGCAQDPNGQPCSLGTIAAGQSASYTLAVTVDSGTAGSLTNSAVVTSATADPDPGNNDASETTYVGRAPDAVDDGPASNSTPGDPFHTPADTTLVAADGSPQDLQANDDVGDPAATITSFGGGDLPGSVVDNPPGTTVSLAGTGSVQVNADGSFQFTPETGFEGQFTFQYELANPLGADAATVTLFVGDRPTAMGRDQVYLSTTSGGAVDDVAYDDEDILVYDLATDSWAVAFDGSDIGLGPANIDGFAIIDNPTADEILFSLTAPTTLTGLGQIDDSDIVRFVGTAGDTTVATSLELWVDGSDLRLAAGGEDIDAITEVGSDLAISTLGSFSAKRPNGVTISGSDEDLSTAILTATGPATAGGLEPLFDGSDVDLTAEDLTSAWSNPADGSIFATSLNGFSVPGLTGDSNDVFMFTGTTGPDTSGTFSTFFDADGARLTNKSIDGLHIVLQSPLVGPTITSDGGGNTAIVSVPENTTAVTDVQATDDADSEGAGLTYSLTGGADQAGFTISAATGVLELSSPPDFELPGSADGDNDYEVTVTVTDSDGLTDTQTITVTVSNVNEAVTAQDDDFTTNEDVALVGDLFADNGNGADFDIDGDTFTVTANTPAANGALTVNPDGSFTYEPDPEFSGSDGFSYTIDDGNGSTDTASVTIQVLPVNDAPEIISDGGGETALLSVPENQTAVTDVDSSDDDDSEGSGLTYSITGGADQGAFSIDATTGVLTFDVAPDHEIPGDDNGSNDYVVAVTVTDSGSPASSDTQTLTVNVTNVDEPAVTIDKRVSINGGGFEDGDTVGTAVAAPLNADAEFEITVVNTGDEDLVSVVVSDSTLGLTVTLPSGLAAGATEVFDSTAYPALSFSGWCDSVGPKVNDASVDATGTNSGATLSMADSAFVDCVNTAPEIISDGGGDAATVSAAENQTAVTNVETVDDADGESLGLVYNLTTTTGGADNGLFSIDATTGVLTFDVAPDFEAPSDANLDGQYEVEVTVGDSGGLTDTQNITVTVADVNDPPIAEDDQFTMDEDTVLNGDLFADNGGGADSDPDGDTFTAIPLTGTSDGLLSVNSDGTFSYTPAPDFNGTDSFTYEVDDGNGGTDMATATIIVENVNDQPVAQDDGFTMDEDGVLNGNVLDDNGNGADGDVDTGDTFFVKMNSNPANGTVTVNSNGTFSYMPGLNFNGSDSFTYELDDGRGGTDTATVSIVVNPINDPPVNTLPGVSFLVTDDATPLPITSIQIADVDAGAGVVVSTLSVTFGSLTVAPGSGATVTGDGTTTVVITGTVAQVNAALNGVVYDPLGTVGSSTITITTDDQGNTGSGGSLSDTDTIDVVVAPSVTAPDAIDDAYDVIGNVGLDPSGSGSVLTNDGGDAPTSLAFGPTVATAAATAADGTNTVTTGAGGTVLLEPDGSFTYNPASGF